MREAIGSSLLFNIVITIVILMIAFLIGSLAYSKAFKVKNRIINIIEKNSGYSGSEEEINTVLSEIGYKKSGNLNTCKKVDNKESLVSNKTYEYCVYELESNAQSSKGAGVYYKVVTYMYFDIPIINSLLKFPVSGETKVIYNSFPDYEFEE